jgi:hypothetical protein
MRFGVFVALRSSSKFHADNFSLARSWMTAGGLADLVRIWWAIAVSGRSTITVFDFFWYRYIGQAKSLNIRQFKTLYETMRVQQRVCRISADQLAI